MNESSSQEARVNPALRAKGGLLGDDYRSAFVSVVISISAAVALTADFYDQ